jgi:histidinol-phosphate aminotransferase
MTQGNFTGPRPRAGIESIAAYVPGKSGSKAGKVHKLSANESPFGPSPKAIAALARHATADLALYPDGQATALREAIAARYGLNAAQIVCASGSGEILQLLASAYLSAGDEAIYSQFGFLLYPIAIASNGAKAIVAPEHNHATDVGEILSRVTPRTKAVFLANPNNPTGTYLPLADVKRLHLGLPSHVLLVLDGAYAEYVLANDYESGIALVESSNNVVMTRSFSKAYGLAGLRLGWAYCPPAIADILNRIRGPFNVSDPALSVGIAAVQDTAFLDLTVAHNAQWKAWLVAELQKLGIDTTPSVANFVLLNFTSAAEAEKIDQLLTARGLILRRVSAYGLPNALRLTVGSEEACRAVIAALTEYDS